MNRGDVEEIHRRISGQVKASFELLAHAHMAERLCNVHDKTLKSAGLPPDRAMRRQANEMVRIANRRVSEALDRFERDVDEQSDMLAEGR